MKKTYSTKKALIVSALSLFLCVAMLAGTTFAWFTDSVSSKNNIIQTGNLDVEMFWADGDEDPANANWIDASTGAMFNHGNWEPGYTQARHIKIANEGSLALNYSLRIVANGVVSKLADVIDVYYFEEATQLQRGDLTDAVKLGTLTDVLTFWVDGNDIQQNLASTVKGSLESGKIRDLTLVLKMKESADNKYQSMDLGCKFSVELTATQMAYEEDSFGSDYDGNTVVPSPELPSAVVSKLDELTIPNWSTSFPNGSTESNPLELAAGYKFQPTELLDQGNLSEYRHWHADFVVKADRDIPADSIALAGYYSAFCDAYNNGNWVALSNAGLPVDADTEIRLVEAMGGGFISVTYKDLCQYGNDGKGFQCGVAALNADALAGTKITVELRMYEVEGNWSDSSANSTETGRYETIGTFTYTFPAAEVKGQDELTAALAGGAADVKLAAGTYTFPTSALKADTTLYCEEGTVFEGKTALNINGATVVGATFTNDNDYLVYSTTMNGTFKDCVFTDCDGLRYCYAGENAVFENCVFDTDFYGVHFDGGANDLVFKNCTFTGFNAFGSAITKLTMENCTFKYNGKGGYNGLNLWGNSELIGCTFVFDGSASYEWVDLCTSNQTVTFTNCVVTDGNTTKALKDVVGNYGNNNTIIIDGETVNIPNMS